MTVLQVADLLQLWEDSVYRLDQKGEHSGFKSGDPWRSRRMDFDSWVVSQIRGSREPR